MTLSGEARIMIGLTLILIPTIQYGGYFLLTQIGSNEIIRTAEQASYFRAGHAHAGVLVILNLIGQLLIDAVVLGIALAWLLRIAFFVAPMLISAGFFLGAPVEGKTPRPLIALLYAGIALLGAANLGLGLVLLFARPA